MKLERERARVLNNFITQIWRDEYFFFLFFVVINLKIEILSRLRQKPALIQTTIWAEQTHTYTYITHVYFSLSQYQSPY